MYKIAKNTAVQVLILLFLWQAMQALDTTNTSAAQGLREAQRQDLLQRRLHREQWRQRQFVFRFGLDTDDIRYDLSGIYGGIDFALPLPNQLDTLFEGDAFIDNFQSDEQASEYEVKAWELCLEQRMREFYIARTHMLLIENVPHRFPRHKVGEPFAPHAYVPSQKLLYARRFEDDQFYVGDLGQIDSDDDTVVFARVRDEQVLKALSNNTLPGMQVAYTARAQGSYVGFDVVLERGGGRQSAAPGRCEFFSASNHTSLLIAPMPHFLYVFALQDGDTFMLCDNKKMFTVSGFSHFFDDMNLVDVVFVMKFVVYCSAHHNQIRLHRSYERFLEHINPEFLADVQIQWIDE